MSKSKRIRIQDVKAAHLILNECRDLGTDPIAWREHMLNRLCTLLGAQNGLATELKAGDESPPNPICHIDVGWQESKHRKTFYKRISEGAVREHPMFLKLMALPRNPSVTVDREMLISDPEWYRSSHFNEFDRLCGLDAGIVGLCEFTLGETNRIDSLTLRRFDGEKKFTERDRLLLGYFHRQLIPMLGRYLASVEEPSASELSPRARQTLNCLLEGDSEKQIAHRLKLSRETVHQYVKMIYRHFRVRSRGELMARWIQFGQGKGRAQLS